MRLSQLKFSKQEIGNEEIISSYNIKHIRTISIIVFLGIFLGIIRSYLGASIHQNYPFNTFLFNPKDRFADLNNMISICSNNNPYFTTIPFPSNYFPVANSIFYLFSLLGNKVLIGCTFFFLFIISYCFILRNIFSKLIPEFFLEVIIVFFFSYPLFFNIDRMNIEIYNFLLCFIWLYYRNSKNWILAIFLLSVSISLKLYTGVFIVLYLKERKFKEIFFTGFFVALLSVISLLTLKGGAIENIKAMFASLKYFTAVYANSDMGLHYNLSLFGILKIVLSKAVKLAGGSFDDTSLLIAKILPIYSLLCFLCFGYIIYVIIKRNLPDWMNLFLLISVFLLFPHVSFDYKLIFLYLPIIFFLKEEKSNDRFNTVFAVGFGLLLIPHNYYYFHDDVSTAILIFPFIILLMTLLILYKTGRKVREFKLVETSNF